ncbi:MAG TPA: ATP-binding protein [Acidobacteriaceae bacterium]|nr:ATP-binding protein [Acidobacteriaceae bacterium]
MATATRAFTMRSLFARVFVTFWLASALVVVSMAVITAVTNARPLAHRWLMHTLDLYADTAVNAYEHGGEAQLASYLDQVRSDSKISAVLLQDDAPLENLDGFPRRTRTLLERARAEQSSQYSFGLPWIGIARSVHNGHTYWFVAQVAPVKMFGNFVDPGKSLFRLVLVLLISATLCGLLARSITNPIATLQRTATAIAGGNLSARASPALRYRQDELASLARDFDRMADRVQYLLDQQKLLLRDISHELRSPLARLGLSAELVQRGDLSAAARMQADIRSLEAMIGDLLTLARIDASERTARRDTVHLGRLIQQIVRDASFEGAMHDRTVVQTGVFERSMLADAGLLHSCIENVVRNALKHSPDGGTVEVNVSDGVNGANGTNVAHGWMIAITVSDEGPGVPADSLEQIFDPFFRVASADSHKQGGAGLGLSISKRIALLYGGNISARNQPGGGLQVQLILPALRPAAADAPSRANANIHG